MYHWCCEILKYIINYFYKLQNLPDFSVSLVASEYPFLSWLRRQLVGKPSQLSFRTRFRIKAWAFAENLVKPRSVRGGVVNTNHSRYLKRDRVPPFRASGFSRRMETSTPRERQNFLVRKCVKVGGGFRDQLCLESKVKVDH